VKEAYEYRGKLNLKKQLFNIFLGFFDAITYTFPLLVIWKYGPFTIIILGYLVTTAYILSAFFSLILGNLIDKAFNTPEKQRKLAAGILLLEATTLLILLIVPLPLTAFSLVFSFYLFLVGQMFTIFMAFQNYLGLTDIESLAGRGILMSIGEILMLVFVFLLASFG
jgi:MFS family permease